MQKQEYELLMANHWVEDWMAARCESPKTREHYKFCLSHWVEFCRARFGKDALSMVEGWRAVKRLGENERECWLEEWQDVVRSFNTWMKPKFAPMTCKNLMSTLKSFCRYWIIPLTVDLPKRPCVIYHNRDLTKEEIKQIVSFASARDRVIYIVLVESGMRVGTAVRVKYWQIKEDFEKGRVPMRIVLPASEVKDRVGDRWTFIGDEGYVALKEYLARRIPLKDDEFVFASEKQGKVIGDQFSPASISVKFNRLVQKLDIDESTGHAGKPKKVRLHGLRKYFRNNMRCDSSFREFWMGHSLGVDGHYVTRNDERQREEYAKGYEYLRLGTANPTEALKQIEELRKENMMLKDQVGKLQQMAPSIEALVKRIEELEKAKEGKAQN
jgi:integrase